MFTEDKDTDRAQLEEAPDKGSTPPAMEDMHIPDYVMLDFGFLEGRGTSEKSPASDSAGKYSRRGSTSGALRGSGSLY